MINEKLQELYKNLEDLMSICMENEDYDKYVSLGNVKETIEEIFE